MHRLLSKMTRFMRTENFKIAQAGRIFGAKTYRLCPFPRLLHCLNVNMEEFKNFPCVKFPCQFCSSFLRSLGKVFKTYNLLI